jgi:recombination associated protein RdgC
MLFKNARVYRLVQTPKLDDALADALAESRLGECGRLEPATAGWTSPYGREHEALVHSAGGCHLIRYGVLEKILPPVVVREALVDRISQAQARTGLPPGRREKLQLKDEVMMDLLPRAFVKPRHVDAYLDPKRRWLIVDSASARAAEDLTMLLRQCLPGLKITAPDMGNRIITLLTHWLGQGRCPNDLALGDEVDLRDDQDEQATARCRHQDLLAAEIEQHLKSGKRVQRLGLTWGESLAFAFSDEFVLSRIKPLEMLQTQLESIDSEEALAELDALFAMTTGELGALIDILAEAVEWR